MTVPANLKVCEHCKRLVHRRAGDSWQEKSSIHVGYSWCFTMKDGHEAWFCGEKRLAEAMNGIFTYGGGCAPDDCEFLLEHTVSDHKPGVI